ncbi:MAG TPA: ATP-binding protein [Myxococcaceae bacterium]
MPILIADGEPAAREALGELCRAVGAEPELVPDAAAARAAAAERRFGCAVVDKNLDGQSGLLLVRELKVLQPDLEVIVATSFGDAGSVGEAFQAGAADYFLKPFDPAMVRQRLQRVLERLRMLEENQQMQRMLIRADRLASLGTLAASVAHEINNPLAYLTSNLQYLQRQLKELAASPAVRQVLGDDDAVDLLSALEDCAEGSERIRLIVQELRSFARADADQVEPVDLSHAVDHALKMTSLVLRDRAQVRKEYATAPRVNASEPRLVQVFVNLIANAGQAFPELSPRNEIRIAVQPRADGAVEAVVADNGPGLTEEARANLFHPFFTTKPLGVGTGLGLSISRTIIRQIGGRLEVDSEPGRGCAFRVVLPAAGGPPLDGPDPARPGP